MHLQILAFVACCALSCISFAQETKPNIAKKHTNGAFVLKSLPVGPDRKLEKASSDEAVDAGYGWYNNCCVNGNSRLLGIEGATQISVYTRDINWRYSFSGRTITSPTGDGASSDTNWRFPYASNFGIVIFQGNNYWAVKSTDPTNPTVITGLSPSEPVIVTVNDTVSNYADNGGAFDLYLRKDN